MSFSPQEVEEFKAEALELLDSAEKSLLALDGGAEFRTAFDTIFRSFHNLKGSAGMMELMKLQAHTHELENILMGFKSATSIPKEYLSLFLRGVDAAKSILDGQDVVFSFAVDGGAAAPTNPTRPEPAAIAATPGDQTPTAAAEVSSAAVGEFVSECLEIIERVSQNLQLLENNAHNKETIDGLYRDVHSLKGSSYLFSYSELGDLAHAMESSLESIRAGTHKASKEFLDVLFKSLRAAEAMIDQIQSGSINQELKDVVSGYVKSLNEISSKLEPAQTVAHPAGETVLKDSNKEKEHELSSVRVPVALLDNLMTLMGEMVLVRNQVLQYSSKSDDLELLSMSKRLNLVTSEIQGQMMKTRMQPVGNILTKFNRVVRDLALDLKKKININLSGTETEIDKSLLEAIKDPLTHIVRNSCDHGIESPEVRKRSDKSEIGTISIKAYHEGGQVIIEVSDDGKGLHKDALLKKALEKSLITEQQAAKMTEKEIFNLIFAPGFSTAAQVTNVSGRGVGMDVVRTNVERIGGFVDLDSAAGRGTKIKLKIPLTLAIIPAMIVKCGNGTFAIPQVNLEELVRVDNASDETKIEFLHGVPVYRLRGNILPLIDLNSLLRVGSSTKESYQNSAYNIAVLSSETTSFGVIIDEIKDTADIVVKPLSRLVKSLQVYSGATILGDGSIALILDVNGISKMAMLGSQGKLVNEQEANAVDEKSKQNSENQDFLLVKLNSATKHALVLNYVHRMEEFKPSAIEMSGNQRVIRYRDMILPLLSANELLGYKQDVPPNGNLPVVVVQRADKLYGIVVNEIVDTLSTPAELSAPLMHHPGILGNLTGESELIVVIDPYELISLAFGQQKDSSSNGVLAGQVAESHPPTPGLGATSSDTGRILLVEDTAFFRKAMKNVLVQEGFEVFTAIDGEEALEILNAKKIAVDVVVSDIEMPRMNGFQLAKAIRKHPGFSTLPMLAISSRADQKYVRDGVEAGFDIYLEKLKPNMLVSAVNTLLKKGKGAA